MQVFNNNIE